MTDWIGAIETGGTKSLAALADRRGEVVFLPPEAGCNPQDGPAWETRLRTLLTAMGRAGQVVLGMAGHGEVPDHDAAVADLAREALGDRVWAMNDVELSFRAAFGHGPGVLVLAGTGSMAMARGTGPIARAGGWGDLIGDEGSAYWIGQRALRLAARALDGQGGDADFACALLARLGQGSDPGAPLCWVMAAREPRRAIAGVARHVDALAEAGTPGAIALLERGAGHLARAARAAARSAGLATPLPWAAAGSVMHSRTLVSALGRELAAAPVPARFNGLGGGLWLAAERAGWRTDGAWAARIGAATRAWGPG